jgi:general secretion pathway protein I
MIDLARFSKHSNRGFSLLEILVAFSILAISLGILLKIFSSGVNTAIIAEEYTLATQVAESLMAKSGVVAPLVAGQSSGIVGEKFHWTVRIENISNPADNTENQSVVSLMDVQVIVRWGDDLVENGRFVELNTIKTGPLL